MFVLDTNVFVYAVGRPHPLRERAVALLRAAREGAIQISSTIDVIQEFAHVSGRRRPRPEAVALTRDVVSAASPLVAMTDRHVALALAIFQHHPALDAFDSFLAAVAIHEADGLVSADRAFAGVDGLRWLDLATLDVNHL